MMLTLQYIVVLLNSVQTIADVYTQQLHTPLLKCPSLTTVCSSFRQFSNNEGRVDHLSVTQICSCQEDHTCPSKPGNQTIMVETRFWYGLCQPVSTLTVCSKKDIASKIFYNSEKFSGLNYTEIHCKCDGQMRNVELESQKSFKSSFRNAGLELICVDGRNTPREKKAEYGLNKVSGNHRQFNTFGSLLKNKHETKQRDGNVYKRDVKRSDRFNARSLDKDEEKHIKRYGFRYSFYKRAPDNSLASYWSGSEFRGPTALNKPALGLQRNFYKRTLGLSDFKEQFAKYIMPNRKDAVEFLNMSVYTRAPQSLHFQFNVGSPSKIDTDMFRFYKRPAKGSNLYKNIPLDESSIPVNDLSPFYKRHQLSSVLNSFYKKSSVKRGLRNFYGESLDDENFNSFDRRTLCNRNRNSIYEGLTFRENRGLQKNGGNIRFYKRFSDKGDLAKFYKKDGKNDLSNFYKKSTVNGLLSSFYKRSENEKDLLKQFANFFHKSNSYMGTIRNDNLSNFYKKSFEDSGSFYKRLFADTTGLYKRPKGDRYMSIFHKRSPENKDLTRFYKKSIEEKDLGDFYKRFLAHTDIESFDKRFAWANYLDGFYKRFLAGNNLSGFYKRTFALKYPSGFYKRLFSNEGMNSFYKRFMENNDVRSFYKRSIRDNSRSNFYKKSFARGGINSFYKRSSRDKYLRNFYKRYSKDKEARKVYKRSVGESDLDSFYKRSFNVNDLSQFYRRSVGKQLGDVSSGYLRTTVSNAPSGKLLFVSNEGKRTHKSSSFHDIDAI